MTTALTIIVPTYNEKDNVVLFVESIDRILTDISWEIIFVDDDSPDGTSSIARSLASRDSRIRCIQRIRRRGLSSACMEGILASSSPYICAMDADMQHDETILPAMYKEITKGALDLIVGSRYVDEGSAGTLPANRKLISLIATKISCLILRVKVSDPMSGYFVISREFFQKVMYKLSGRGFKILLDMLASSEEPVRLKEIPYTMRSRARGESKLNLLVAWDFFMLVLHRFFGALAPYRFLSFAAVGFSGLCIHLFVLWMMYDLSATDFTLSQSIATFVAMTSNYLLNNIFTYYDTRKTGKNFWIGLLSFYLVCMFGAIVNVALATELYQRNIPWLISGIFGAVAGAVWNFTVSNIFVWRLYARFKQPV